MNDRSEQLNSSSETLDNAAAFERSIFRIGRSFRRLLNTGDGGTGQISLTGFWELFTIRDTENCRPSDLAASMNLDLSTVSRQIKALESSGLLVREVDSKDGRVARLRLSPAGLAIVDEMILLRRERLAEALSGWDEHDTELLLSLLDRLGVDLESR